MAQTVRAAGQSQGMVSSSSNLGEVYQGLPLKAQSDVSSEGREAISEGPQGEAVLDSEGMVSQEEREGADGYDAEGGSMIDAKLTEEGGILALVNQWHPITSAMAPELMEAEGYQVDIRCGEALLTMLTDCREAGFQPEICSAYRSHDMQISLYEKQVLRHLKEGRPQEEAERLAGEVVAFPGTSEHELGLAVDIVDGTYQILDETQAGRPTQQWLMENSWRYGFVLRYPTDRRAVTGIIYEPWHYRYVGLAAAQEMYEQGLCLEEYLGA